ncbi:hypothetical protein N493_19755 (plasmid) [Clostridium botulinum B2 433]|uniref:hypothetical protein n=1 Tax=Clostridium botulinum TaxID=1491 RepID=UPI0007DEC88A|nr:hypothetical protein [Clostridium botulinum]KEI84128.1 hypothetical protein N493_19755 [Clostridium botulinum B2 433]
MDNINNEIFKFYMGTFEQNVLEDSHNIEEYLKKEYKYENNNEFMNSLINNYILVQSEIMRDLKEINNRIKQINEQKAELKPSTYQFRKLEYCKRINLKEKEKIEEFFTNESIGHIKERVINREKWERAKSGVKKLFDIPYEYVNHKRFYEPTYDFSTDVKFRFLLFQNPSEIQNKIKLKTNDKEKYYTDIDLIIKEKKVFQKIMNNIINHHLFIKRKEIFETLYDLYNREKFESFINLAVIQIEGLFYDFCLILNDEKEIENIDENIGTLSVKAEKVFASNKFLWLSAYPYFAYDAPIFRNKIAHNGLYNSNDNKNFANELILDLYFITELAKISNIFPYDILQVVIRMRRQIKTLEFAEDDYGTILKELFFGFQPIKNKDSNVIFEILKKKNDRKESLKFYQIHVNNAKCTNLYEECVRITKVIFEEKFWDIIISQLQDETKYEGGKPYDFVEFAKSISNNYINEFKNKEKLKQKCIEVNKELKRLKV